jgi:predicted small secreted protein
MKKCIYIAGVILAITVSCTSTKSIISKSESSIATQNDTVRIANDELEYEVIIIDGGFNTRFANFSLRS